MPMRTVALLTALLIAGQALADPYDPPATYYNAATSTGAALKNQLHGIIDNHTVFSYGDARSILQITDQDPNNPDNIILVYDRTSLDVSGLSASGIPGWDSGLSWNREHTWPRSRGVDDTGVDNTDLHNLRPADPGINSARSNDNFGGAYGQGYGSVGSYWYPGNADAGMVARQMFYMDVRYDGSDADTVDLTLVNGNPGSFNNTLGDLSRMIEWHYAAVPDDFERRRNDIIYDNYQGNRNPFIDRPEYVWSVFVDQNNDSRVTVAGGTTGADPSQSSLTLDFGTALVGASVATQQNVTLNKAGNDGTYYEVVVSGNATSDQEGRFNAFNTNGTDSQVISVGLDGGTSTAGFNFGTVTIDNLDITTGGGAGRGANDADDVITTQLTVLDHINASFSGAADQNTKTINFGPIPQGSFVPGIGFDIFNLENTPGFTATMDIDSPNVFGSTKFSVDGLTGTVVAGSSITATATVDTTTTGTFGATWLLSVSDPDLPGEQNQAITLSLQGQIIAWVNGDTDGDGDIDDADLATAFSNFTGPAGAAGGKTAYDGDTDGDGDVDDADLAVAFSGFTGPTGAPTNVPEPGAGVVLMSLAVITVSRRRRFATAA